MNLPREDKKVSRWLMSFCAAAALSGLCGCWGVPQTDAPQQPAQTSAKPKQAPHAKAAPKPEPTQDDLYTYVRGKLLSLSPSDGVDDNQDVAFDPASSVLSITSPDGKCEITLGALDGNTMIWDAYDPSDNLNQREAVLRLTFTSLSGKKARVCYDEHNQQNANLSGNRVRFLFSQRKASTVPDFTDKMGKAMKKLILLAGGSGGKDPI
jgi:hypothetical protein